jgi:hypothetical protein
VWYDPRHSRFYRLMSVRRCGDGRIPLLVDYDQPQRMLDSNHRAPVENYSRRKDVTSSYSMRTAKGEVVALRLRE